MAMNGHETAGMLVAMSPITQGASVQVPTRTIAQHHGILHFLQATHMWLYKGDSDGLKIANPLWPVTWKYPLHQFATTFLFHLLPLAFST